MTPNEYLQTSLLPIKVQLPENAPEAFCSTCQRVARFATDPYTEAMTYSACCSAPPVRLRLV